jgi:hypothetical protein
LRFNFREGPEKVKRNTGLVPIDSAIGREHMAPIGQVQPRPNRNTNSLSSIIASHPITGARRHRITEGRVVGPRNENEVREV